MRAMLLSDALHQVWVGGKTKENDTLNSLLNFFKILRGSVYLVSQRYFGRLT